MIYKRIIGLMFFCLLLLEAKAQLISPGKLITGHAAFEGINNCTTCHTLGKKGIDNTKCLSCHEPIKETQTLKIGFHSTVDVVGKNCATCHKDHYGREFDAQHFDSTAFDHAVTKFPLAGKHMELSCIDCHQTKLIERNSVKEFTDKHKTTGLTYLGLISQCATCHKTDNPHENQFIGQACSDCHTERDWKDVSKFDHEKTAFPLLGKHQTVDCASCHKPVSETSNVIQYKGIDFATCKSCHEDVHKNKLGADCQSCHIENSFHTFFNFPEKTYPHEETGFELVGAHKVATCASCHAFTSKQDTVLYGIKYKKETLDYTYKHPLATECESCHKDIHGKLFKDAIGKTICTDCHTQSLWVPSSFSIEQHNTKASFALAGAHIATPCFSCHATGDKKHDFPAFRFASKECESCHEKDNPHGDEFHNDLGITACAECHSVANWKTSSFDHNTTKFPLLGKHSIVSCEQCHVQEPNSTKKEFHLASMECQSCHTKDDVHQGQFKDSNIGQNCAICHDNNSFKMASFDHELTRFSLKGAHETVTCISCHKTEITKDETSFVRYVPLSTKCSSCHESAQ